MGYHVTNGIYTQNANHFNCQLGEWFYPLEWEFVYGRHFLLDFYTINNQHHAQQITMTHGVHNVRYTQYTATGLQHNGCKSNIFFLPYPGHHQIWLLDMLGGKSTPQMQHSWLQFVRNPTGDKVMIIIYCCITCEDNCITLKLWVNTNKQCK